VYAGLDGHLHNRTGASLVPTVVAHPDSAEETTKAKASVVSMIGGHFFSPNEKE